MSRARRRRYVMRCKRYAARCEAIGGFAGDRYVMHGGSLLEALREMAERGHRGIDLDASVTFTSAPGGWFKPNMSLLLTQWTPAIPEGTHLVVDTTPLLETPDR